MDLLSHEVHQPATVFLPSDEALGSLPPEQKNFLFHKENRPQLVEYLKFHILPAQKVTTERVWTCLGHEHILSHTEEG